MADMTKKKSKIKYSAEYINYIKSGESAAVFIVRDICDSIDTSGYWIDILDAPIISRTFDKWNFDRIDIELFPRKINPVYNSRMSDKEKKYVTWETAKRDIEQQRRNGFVGNKYRIVPKLYNKNKKNSKLVRKLWNKTFNRYVPERWKTSSCEYRMVQEAIPPKWEYTIVSVKKL